MLMKIVIANSTYVKPYLWPETLIEMTRGKRKSLQSDHINMGRARNLNALLGYKPCTLTIQVQELRMELQSHH